MSKDKGIPIDQWRWLGQAAHFIGADNCRFRLATIIGKYVVSTVGNYYLHGRDGDGPVSIGAGRTYETYVFHCDGLDECGCCANITDYNEIRSCGYTSGAAATLGHMDMCRQIARLATTNTTGTAQ